MESNVKAPEMASNDAVLKAKKAEERKVAAKKLIDFLAQKKVDLPKDMEDLLNGIANTSNTF